jgi:hypothetical protein
VNDSLASFHPDVLPMSFIRACSSRSRRYMRVYRFSLKDGAGRGTSDKTEEYVKTLRKCRSHRSALDSHTTFCRDAGGGHSRLISGKGLSKLGGGSSAAGIFFLILS